MPKLNKITSEKTSASRYVVTFHKIGRQRASEYHSAKATALTAAKAALFLANVTSTTVHELDALGRRGLKIFTSKEETAKAAPVKLAKVIQLPTAKPTVTVLFAGNSPKRYIERYASQKEAQAAAKAWIKADQTGVADAWVLGYAEEEQVLRANRLSKVVRTLPAHLTAPKQAEKSALPKVCKAAPTSRSIELAPAPKAKGGRKATPAVKKYLVILPKSQRHVATIEEAVKLARAVMDGPSIIEAKHGRGYRHVAAFWNGNLCRNRGKVQAR
jgi:hypothetical protein